MHHRQAKTDSLADPLGREEALDRSRERRLIHATTSVGNRQAEVEAGSQLSAMPPFTSSALVEIRSVPPE
jgi:hypothetical protein